FSPSSSAQTPNAHLMGNQPDALTSGPDREGIVNLPQPSNLTTGDDVSDAPVSDRHHSALRETAFHHMISLERKRTERSRKPFLLMLFNANGGLAKDQKAELLAQALSLLSACRRGTDAAGWYKNDS